MEQFAISSPGDLPNPGMEATPPGSPALQANSLPAEPLGQHTSLSKVPLSALSTSTSRGMLPK